MMKSVLAAFTIGIVASVTAILVSLFVLGPLVRLVLGPPLDFGTDNVTVASQHQALAVELFGFGVIFLLAGVIYSKRDNKPLLTALVLANPVSVGLGFLAVRTANRDLLSEYIGLPNCLTLPLLSVVVLAPLTLLGKYLRRRWSETKRTAAFHRSQGVE